MSIAVDTKPIVAESSSQKLVLSATLLGTMTIACALAGLAPIGFSIVTVFLFAGPHNWLEARYMLTRMPGRWGALTPYFATGLIGVPVLTLLFAAIPIASWYWNWKEAEWLFALAVWNSLLVVWIVSLALMRSRQNPRRDWLWLVPVGFVVTGLNWLSPSLWSLSLVYVHPLMALWFLDRELGRERAVWRTTYRSCLACLPLFLAVLWWLLADSPNLPGDDLLTTAIAQHSGAGLVGGVSSHFLVAAHTFLEMLHYGVWIVAIPLVTIRRWPWQTDNVPLAKRSTSWRGFVLGTIGVGAAVMVLLWAMFLADYPATRNVYFTVAMLHVLAEVPFLLRLL